MELGIRVTNTHGGCHTQTELLRRLQHTNLYHGRERSGISTNALPHVAKLTSLTSRADGAMRIRICTTSVVHHRLARAGQSAMEFGIGVRIVSLALCEAHWESLAALRHRGICRASIVQWAGSTNGASRLGHIP